MFFAFVLLLVAPPASEAHEIPKSVTDSGVREAGGRPAAPDRSRAARGDARRGVPAARSGLSATSRELAPLLPQATKVWIADDVHLYEEDTRLAGGQIVATRVSLPSDRSFETLRARRRALRRAAASRVDRPRVAAGDARRRDRLPDRVGPIALLDRSRAGATRRAHDDGAALRSARRAPSARSSTSAIPASCDSIRAGIRPRSRFVRLGFEHILDGIDHLLFIFCLVIPFRRIRPLVAIVTSFTVAHSITLIASAAGLAPDALWFPPLIEVLIALSIVYMALENIVGPKLERRALIAFGFGLVHGFGFSFALRESLQFAGAHLATSLVAFNVGVELGQLFVLALAVPALALLFRYGVKERMGTIILSAFVAHTAWHWMLDRGAVLTPVSSSACRRSTRNSSRAGCVRSCCCLSLVGPRGA